MRVRTATALVVIKWTTAMEALLIWRRYRRALVRLASSSPMSFPIGWAYIFSGRRLLRQVEPQVLLPFTLRLKLVSAGLDRVVRPEVNMWVGLAGSTSLPHHWHFRKAHWLMEMFLSPR